MKGSSVVASLVLAVLAPGIASAKTCETEDREVDGASLSTRVCIVPMGMFKPNRVEMRIGGKTVFKGTDYEDVVFTGKYKDKQVTGGCIESVTVTDMRTMKAAPLSSLPPELVEACRITADEAGVSLPFAKTKECDTVFYTALEPLLGKVVPTSDARHCTVQLDGAEIFSKGFKLP